MCFYNLEYCISKLSNCYTNGPQTITITNSQFPVPFQRITNKQYVVVIIRPLCTNFQTLEDVQYDESYTIRHRQCLSTHYRANGAMHFSAKRGLAIACRLSVCLSVSLENKSSTRNYT